MYLLNYHFVWTPKRRKPVLVGEVGADCRALIEKKCIERGWKILELAVQPDPIHLFVSIFPDESPSQVIKECKGVTSYYLRKKYAALNRLPSLWTRSYFVVTAGNVSGEIIQQYIAAQKGV